MNADRNSWWHDRWPGPSHRNAFAMRPREALGSACAYDHDHHGRMLVVAGALRSVESDRAYVEMATHLSLCGGGPWPAGVRVLIVGGEDGGLASEALRHAFVNEVVVWIAEPDGVALAHRHLPAGEAFSDPRVRVVTSQPEGTFQVILADLLAEEPSPAPDLATLLAPNGVCCVGARAIPGRESAWVHAGTCFAAAAALGPAERAVVPTALSPGCFVILHLHRRDGGSCAVPLTNWHGRHYDPAVHRAAFAVPTWWRGPLAIRTERAAAGDPAAWWHEATVELATSQALAMTPVHAERSPYQLIEIHDHQDYGRVFSLDGTVQGTTADEAIYHEMVVHVALAGGERLPRRVLIIGGGDWGAAREVLRHPEIEQVVMVEIDARVLAVCETLFAIGRPVDPRLELRVMDAADYIAQAAQRGEHFDVVIIDATDSTEPSRSLFTDSFYAQLKTCLGEDGVCVDSDIVASSAHGASMSRDVIGPPLADLRRVRAAFGAIEAYMTRIPTYPGGLFTFFIYSRSGASKREPRRLVEARFYNAEVHRAAFVLPPWWAETLANL
ncbi:hypothetical protein LBMAG53_08230 [Planctomycetota bacterium]|nr:hypothetical protein LBMAG53_08230 [Planctomycetota bacterium]